MPFSSLRDYIEFLEDKKLIKRVKKQVSCYLELTEVSKRVIEKRGPALLFENVTNKEGDAYKYQVVSNLFADEKRIGLSIGRSKEEMIEFGKDLAFLRQPEPPKNFSDIKEMLPMAKTILAVNPKKVKKAPCHEIVLKGDEVDLTKLPIQHCWPEEPAPLVTWGLTVTKGPNPDEDKTDCTNIGVYRLQLLGKNRLIMRWLAHRGGAQHFAKFQKTHPNMPMPAAVVIGADPATMLAAATPVPDNMSEYQFAGILRGKKTEITDCVTVPLEVPSQAEIVLEGHILPEKALEGPYGDHTGYYNSQEEFPVFEVSAITMRKNPIYVTTYTSRPPDEPSIIAVALNDLFVPIIKQQFPEIVDFWLPPEGCSYRIAVVSIKKAYAGHARRIMMGVWSYLRQFTYTKFVIVVDDNIDVHKWEDVMWAISTKVDPVRDVMMVENTPIDYLDFASVKEGLGSKMGIDATDKIDAETDRQWGREMHMNQDVIDKVSACWEEYDIE